MRDLGEQDPRRVGTPDPLVTVPALDEIEALAQLLSNTRFGDLSDLSDASRIDLIAALEDLKSVAEGTQAILTAAFETSQRAAAAAAGVPAERQGRGVALQIALARRESHHRGRRHLALAKVLRDELPHTLDALRTGCTTEWRATLMARETACLSLEDRQEIDLRIAGDPDRFEQMGDRDVQDAARALACELDPAAVAERRRRAEADRHTTLRPAPDTMTFFTALLPVKDGVAVHQALLDEATRLRAAGDPRSRGAIMADTLVRRVLAPHVTHDGTPADVPLVIHVVVPDSVLLGNTNGVGWVEEYGDVPGDLLREWIAAHAENGTQDWVKRLYATPETGQLVGMDKKGRRFDGALAEFLRLRDRRCATRYCGAPVRHLDHITPHAQGGPTSATNAQGLCEDCNYAKQAPGWRARPRPGPTLAVETTTPTGHRYTSGGN